MWNASNSVPAAAHGVDRHLHVRDLAGGRALGGESGDVDLERSAHLEEVEQCVRVTAKGDLEEVPDEAAVRHGDPGATALADLEQAARRESPGRLADAEPAHAEGLGELSFGRQRRTGLETVKDQGLELFDHRVHHGGAADGLELA